MSQKFENKVCTKLGEITQAVHDMNDVMNRRFDEIKIEGCVYGRETRSTLKGHLSGHKAIYGAVIFICTVAGAISVWLNLIM